MYGLDAPGSEGAAGELTHVLPGDCRGSWTALERGESREEGGRMGYGAMVINPDHSVRNRLKSLAAMTGAFGSFGMASTLQEGLERLQGENKIEVLYLASRFDPEVSRRFVEQAKLTKQGRKSAFVTFFGMGSGTRTEVAAYVAGGIDGILVEPFSAEGLLEVTQNAVKASRRKYLERQLVALRTLTEEAVRAVDSAAEPLYESPNPVANLRDLRRVGTEIAKIDEDLYSLYVECLTETFAALSPARYPTRKRRTEGYEGPSRRVRHHIIRKP